jgi:hypothetical protein
MSYLRYLCLFAHSNVQHILCCVFLRLVYPMLPVSLDCPFLIFPSVFSNVYLNNYGQQFHPYFTNYFDIHQIQYTCDTYYKVKWKYIKQSIVSTSID